MAVNRTLTIVLGVISDVGHNFGLILTGVLAAKEQILMMFIALILSLILGTINRKITKKLLWEDEHYEEGKRVE